MKSILSILFYLLGTLSLITKAYSQQGKFRCDSLMIENHYEEKHWAYPSYFNKDYFYPSYNNTYHYTWFNIEQVDELKWKNKKDTNSFYYCNHLQCPVPFNTTDLTIKLGENDTPFLYLSNNKNIVNIYVEDDFRDTIFLFNLFNELAQLENLKTLDILIPRRFSLPTNIKKLKQLVAINLNTDYRNKTGMDLRNFDTIYYNEKKITRDYDFYKKKDYLNSYFIFKPLDELYELENLKYLTISTWGSLDINQNNLAKLKNLEIISLAADSIYYLKDDLFSKNNIQHINLLWNKPGYIEQQLRKSHKIIYQNGLPKCLLSASHSLKSFNCNFLKITDNLSDLYKLTHLISIQTNILDLKTPRYFDGYYHFDNLKELTFYSPEDFPYPIYKGKIINGDFITSFWFTNLNKLTFIGQFPKQPHFIRRMFISNSQIKDIELVDFKGNFLQFMKWNGQYKDVNLKIISTDINKLYESVERGLLWYIPKFNKISFLYDDLIDCKVENLVRIKCDTLEITY